MDNLDTIKYKENRNGWFVKIFLDENGNEASRLEFADGKGSGTGLFKEMQAWEEAGNEIEPQYTTEELTQKETDDFNNAIESQKSTCVQLLNETDSKLISDTPYPDDIQVWVDVRNQWRVIIKSDKIEEIPDKPF